MSSVGSNKFAFWAARNSDASSDAVVAEITVVLRRARFRDTVGVDMKAGGAGQRTRGRRYSDGGW